MGIISTFIRMVLGAIELLLTLRFIFKFFTLNPGAPFVSWLYRFTASLIAPFAGILPDVKLAGFVIEFTTLFALIIYVVIGHFILRALAYARAGIDRI